MADSSTNSCLFNIITGNGAHQSRPPPPVTPKEQATEHEIWLEQEVARLQRESWRLQGVNSSLRSELFFLESSPKRTVTDMTLYFDNLPMDAGQSDFTEDDDDWPEQDKEAEGKRVKFDIIRTTTGDGAHDDEDLDGLRHRGKESVPSLPEGRSISDATLIKRMFSQKSMALHGVKENMNHMVARGSALTMTRPAQAMIYSLALGFAIFVLIATATHLGAPTHHDDPHAADHGGDDHGAGGHDAADAHADPHGHARRLGGGVSPLMKNIANTLAASGLVALVINYLKLPLILAYLIGGVVVGPLGLNIVQSHLAMTEMSNLGLIFLLFMVGLELDVKALVTKMGKVTYLTGLVQIPICSGIMAVVLLGLEQTGISFGGGKYGALYCGAVGGLSSTMLVVKILENNAMADSIHGRTTVGLLICQNIWLIVILALQMNLSDPNFLGLIKTFGCLVGLILFTLFYAKFVMPAALYCASTSVELMLVLSLAWCFFICTAAILPFVDLPMEIAALVAGIALATFPYSSEFNSKIKYIRDFFFTLFFAGMGMMLPWPHWSTLGASIAMCLTLLAVRWAGVFAPAVLLGAAPRYAGMVTLNLSQVGEFALVVTMLGVAHGHVDTETLEVVIMAFAFMSISTPMIIKNNFVIYKKLVKTVEKWRGIENAGEPQQVGEVAHAEKDDGVDREIMLLGFHKVAYMLMGEFFTKTPDLLKTIHVVDYNKKVLSKLSSAGIKCTAGDITDPEVLENAQRNPPRMVISTIPDNVLQGTTNEQIVRIVKSVFPTARVIVTAGDPHQAKVLYKAGADYVVRMAKLSAERLHDLLSEHGSNGFERSSLKELFDQYRTRDNLSGVKRFLGSGFFSS